MPLAVHAASVATNVALGAMAPSHGLPDPWYGLPLLMLDRRFRVERGSPESAATPAPDHAHVGAT